MKSYRDLPCRYYKTDTLQRYDGKLAYGLNEELSKMYESRCQYTCMTCNATLSFEYRPLEKVFEEYNDRREIGRNSRSIKQTKGLDARSIEDKLP